MKYKSATLRFALGKLRRNCSIEIRTMNGASQQKPNHGYKAGNHIKGTNLKSKIYNLKLTVLPYFCPR